MNPTKRAIALAVLLTASLTFVGLSSAGDHSFQDLQASDLFKKGSSFTESIDVLYDVEQGGELSLGTTNGSVKINTWAKDQIRLVITKTTSASSPYNARTILEDFLVVASHKGKDLQLKASANTDDCKKSVGVTFTVWVPKNYNVDIDTGDGNVNIGKLNGSFSAKTGNGKISFECEPNGMDIEVEDHTTGSTTEIKRKDVADNDDESGDPVAAPAKRKLKEDDTKESGKGDL
jgi:hypothetical protein